MADYTPVGWVNELTKLSAANFAQMDAGIKDAAEHQNSGSVVARPAADAAHKHHIWRDENGESWYCDGTQWVSMNRGVRQSPNTLVASAPGSVGNPKGIDSYGYTAWKFQFAQAGVVNVAELFLRRDAAATGSYFFSICPEAVGGGPDEGASLAQWTVDISTLPTNAPPAATVFDIGPLMVTQGMVGVNYYIVTTPLFYTGAPGTFRWYSRTGATANGDFYYSLNSGGTWTTEPAGAANIALYSADALTLRRTLTRGNLLSVIDDVTGTMLARIANDGQLYGPGGRRVGTTPVVTALPVSPQDGDEVIFQNTSMANNGVGWRLRYNAFSPNTHKWECIGGSVFYARDPAVVNTANVGSVNYAGPQHTVPLAGFYEVTQSLNAFPNPSQGLVQSDLYDAANALLIATGEAFIQGWVTPTSPGPNRFQGHRTGLFPVALAAGSTIKMGYSGDNNGVAVRFRSIGIKPIRVG